MWSRERDAWDCTDPALSSTGNGEKRGSQFLQLLNPRWKFRGIAVSARIEVPNQGRVLPKDVTRRGGRIQL